MTTAPDPIAPYAGVKEQIANLYATRMAELGFATLSIELSFAPDSDNSGCRASVRMLQESIEQGRLQRHVASQLSGQL